MSNTLHRKITFGNSDLTTSGTTKPSSEINIRGMGSVTVYMKYTGDVAITVEGRVKPNSNVSDDWSLDGSTNVSAGDSTTQYEYEVFGDEHHQLQINASADSSDASSGQLEVWVVGGD